jgi:hypothetical protein
LFLAHVYALALKRELLGRRHRVGREASVNIVQKGLTLTSHGGIRLIRFDSVYPVSPNSTNPRFAFTGRDTCQADCVRHEHQFCIIPLGAPGATVNEFVPFQRIAPGWFQAGSRL